MDQFEAEKPPNPQMRVTHKAECRPEKPLNKSEENIYYKAQVDALFKVIKIITHGKP